MSIERALCVAVPSNPLMAEEIHGVCVYQKEMNRDPRLVWMITGNNISESGDLGTKMRSFIDAKTGELLSFCIYP